MKREIKHHSCVVELLDADGFAIDPAGWLAGNAGSSRMAWFLAHADDGVIWGRLQEGRLVTSGQLSTRLQVSPPLRAVTLQQARLFSESEEVRVWRKEIGFHACRLYDMHNEKSDSFDEEHILWGTHAEARENGFTFLAEGKQGLRHVVPLNAPGSSFGVDPRRYRPLRLLLRHYLDYDIDGRARVVLSRLLDLRFEPIRMEGEIKE